MVRILLTAFGIITINVLLQSLVYIAWSVRVDEILNEVKKKLTPHRKLWLLAISFFTFTILHVLQSFVWAGLFYILPETKTQFLNFTEALYFSLITFTTLGYGDITIHSVWRLLSGFEAINGIMLIGWTTAIMFSLIQKIMNRSTISNG